MEMGTNEGEGTTPWGTVPGMASKAFWIYTHDAYMKKISHAVSTRTTRGTATAKNTWVLQVVVQGLQNRESPFSVSLNARKIIMANQRNGPTTLPWPKVQPVSNAVTSYLDSRSAGLAEGLH